MIHPAKVAYSGQGQIAMRFRRVELLKEVRFFFCEKHEAETRCTRTDVFMLLKKNAAFLVVLTLLQMHSNLPLVAVRHLCRANPARIS